MGGYLPLAKETYDIHVYNNWFSKLTPVINEEDKTIVLKAPNSFVQEEITKRYGKEIKKVVSSFGLQFQGIN
jgi:chromosomal replication initiation ATPase DnaA